LLKFRGRLQQTWIAGALPKPVQHHRRQENRRRRVRLALTGAPPPGQLEREFVDAFGARARDHHRITRFIIAKPHALAARGEQPFRVFAHENQIDVAGARRGER
jgi:hypothetical protein